MSESGQWDETEGGLRNLRRFLPFVLVLITAGVFFAAGFHRGLAPESLLRHHDHARQVVAEHRLAAAGVYAVLYVAVVSLSIPASAVLTTIGGYLFGWALGGSVAAVAATIGATNIFLIARTSLGELFRRRAGGRLKALAEGFKRDAFSYLLFLRLLPVMPFWITNLAAALFGMRLRTFVVATQLGMLPVSFAFAVAGSGLGEVVARQKEAYGACKASGATHCQIDLDPANLMTTELALALTVLGILALAPILVRRWRNRREEEMG